MGSGTNILIHKSWHPLTHENIEKTYLAEEARRDELRKMEEVKKRLEEERDLEELRRTQIASGLRPKEQRLEWMYTVQGAQKRNTEGHAGLGAGDMAQPEGEYQGSVDELNNESKASLVDMMEMRKSRRDAEAKLRDDPLFGIKLAEIENVRSKVQKSKDSVDTKGLVLEVPEVMRKLAERGQKVKKEKRMKKEKVKKEKKEKKLKKERKVKKERH